MLGDLPAAFFLRNVLQLHQQRQVILRLDSLAIWKIINVEDAVLIKKIDARTFPEEFCTRNICGRASRYATTPWIVALSPSRSVVTRVRPWSPGQDRKSFGLSRKKSKFSSDDLHHWRFWSAFGNFETHFAESFRMSKSSWMTDPTRPRETTSCSAIDLAEIWRSSKISSWIWSIISGVVTVLGRPGRGASHVEKSPRLNWSTQFFDGGIRWCTFP